MPRKSESSKSERNESESSPSKPFEPFADDAAVQTLGGFSIENGRQGIALHGSLDLTRDREGLKRAKALKALLDAIVSALEAEDLPEQDVGETRAPRKVANPFA